MRLALDARTIYAPSRRGIGKTLATLYRRLAALQPTWQVLAYHRAATPEPTETPLPRPFAQPRHIEMIGDRFDAWQRFRLPMAALRDDADLLHCPANTCPSWVTVPMLVTIHDLIPLDMPLGRSMHEVHRFEQSVRIACRRAAWITCPSAYTRDRLVNEFDADPFRMTVNPWAPDEAMCYVPPEEAGAVLKRYHARGVFQGPFVLHLGAGELRKNTHGLLEAWAHLDAHARRHWRLVIVGLEGDSLNEVRAHATKLHIIKSVRANGYASDEDLAALMSAADILAYPSLSEGFGLPILDAWVTRTAVLAGNRTSIPEVAGDAALLVDPTDNVALADGLSRLMEDANLRLELIARGEDRLPQYDWTQCAKRFAMAAEHAVGEAGLRLAA